MKALQGKPQSAAKPSTKKGGRANGSDFSSARGSEERNTTMTTQGGRGPRRHRDYDLEPVSKTFLSCQFFGFYFFPDCGPSPMWTPVEMPRWRRFNLKLHLFIDNTFEKHLALVNEGGE
jgi:hypothetical protein